MAAFETVSLFDSFVPSTNNKGHDLIKRTTFGRKNAKKTSEFNLRLAELIFVVAGGALKALKEGHYKKFDALKKDFGCQITALDLQQKIQKPEVVREALQVRKAIKQRLENIRKVFEKSVDIPLGEPQETFQSFLKDRVGVDIILSQDLVTLIRAHFLCIINANAVVDNAEKPYTNIRPLADMAKRFCEMTPISNIVLNNWVLAIQIDESLANTRFIKEQADLLTEGDTPRVALLQRVLQETFIRFSSQGIASLPLLHNGEVVLQRIQGPILVKNKLFLGDKRLEDREAIKIFIDLPSCRIMTDEEVAALPPKQTLPVLEGYINSAEELKKLIQEEGLFAMFNANSAQHPQYASMTDQSAIADEEAEADVRSYKERKDIPAIIDLDHMFCSSVGDER